MMVYFDVELIESSKNSTLHVFLIIEIEFDCLDFWAEFHINSTAKCVDMHTVLFESL